MIVTEIEPYTKTKFKVYLDGKFAFVLYKGELSRYGIRRDEVITDGTVEKIETEVILKRAKLRAMHLLEDMDRTEAALREKLRQGCYTQEMIDRAVDYVKSFGYLDDARYAENFVRSRQGAKSRKEIRAALMQKAAEEHPGKMAAVLKLPFEKVEEICAQVGEMYPVNYNCPGQVSVAGAADRMDELVSRVKEAKGRAVVLAVGGGFHSPYMQEAAQAFLPEIQAVGMQEPRVPVYANRTAKPYAGDMAALLADQIQSPVLWQKTLETMMESGIDTMIEVGPGKTLYGFVQRLAPDFTVFHCDTVQSLNEIVETLA